jgi:general secretion pathway protein J
MEGEVMMHRRSRSAGFTLVEVLVALALMAAMATIAWRGIDGMLRSREISQQRLQATERLQTALAQWETDLRQLQDSSQVNPLAFDGASLLLTRRQPYGLQVVMWSLRNGRLQRWESPVVTTRSALTEAYAMSAQALARDQQQLVVLDGVSSWQLYYYRNNSWSNAQSSGDEAAEPGAPPAPAPRRTLPSGVRMLLEFAPGGGLQGRLTRQIELELPQ